MIKKRKGMERRRVEMGVDKREETHKGRRRTGNRGEGNEKKGMKRKGRERLSTLSIKGQVSKVSSVFCS